MMTIARAVPALFLLALASFGCADPAAEDGPVEYELVLKPYVQLGDAELGATADQLVVTWQTLARTGDQGNDDTFTCEFRRAGESTWTRATLETPITIGAPERQNHYAVLRNLPFDDQIEYRVTHLRNGKPVPGDVFQERVNTRKTHGPFRFTVSSNTGNRIRGRPEDRALIASFLLAQNIDFHVILGDIVYQRGEYENYKSRFFETYDPLMATKIFFYTPGNHESRNHRALPALEHFFLPTNGPPSRDPERFYSFDYGNAHFVALDTTETKRFLQLSPLDIQRWLAADLAASKKTWKIVLTHETPLALDPCSSDREGFADLREVILATAVDAGVDLYLGGSSHSYQRYLPIHRVESDPLPANVFTQAFAKAREAVWMARIRLGARFPALADNGSHGRESGPHGIGDPSVLVGWSASPEGKGTTLIYSGNSEWIREPSCPGTSELLAPLAVYDIRRGFTVYDVDDETLRMRMIAQDGETVLDTITLRK